LQKQGNVVRLEKLNAETVQLEEERARLEHACRNFNQRRCGKTQHPDFAWDCRGTPEAPARIAEELTGANQNLDGRCGNSRKALSPQYLEQLQGDYEGFGAGAVAALKGRGGVSRSLTDKIRVPNEHVPAIEALSAQICSSRWPPRQRAPSKFFRT